jgi:plastocyanin
VRTAIFAATVGLMVSTLAVSLESPTKPQTHTVTIEAMRFQPEVLSVASGDTIVWVNKGLVPHTATSVAGGFDSKDIQVDKSWSYTIRTKGDFAYTCTFHPTMKAMLRVN